MKLVSFESIWTLKVHTWIFFVKSGSFAGAVSKIEFLRRKSCVPKPENQFLGHNFSGFDLRSNIVDHSMGYLNETQLFFSKLVCQINYVTCGGHLVLSQNGFSCHASNLTFHRSGPKRGMSTNEEPNWPGHIYLKSKTT